MNERIKRLQQEMEAAIRQEGFVAGWEAAMQAILKTARTSPPNDILIVPHHGSENGTKYPNAMPRGATDLVVEHILREVAPRALSPTQIIITAKNSGSVLSESAVGRALRKLTNQGKAEQVGDSKSWRAALQSGREEQLNAFGISPHAKVVGIKS